MKNQELVSYINGQSLMNDNFMISIVKNKGVEHRRTAKTGQTIKVYRNLHKGAMFSFISLDKDNDKGKVVGYAEAVILENPEFLISETQRQRAVREQQRNVHSFVKGTLVDAFLGELAKNDLLQAASYNPFKAGHFFDPIDLKPIDAKNYKFAILANNRVFLLN